MNGGEDRRDRCAGGGAVMDADFRRVDGSPLSDTDGCTISAHFNLLCSESGFMPRRGDEVELCGNGGASRVFRVVGVRFVSGGWYDGKWGGNPSVGCRCHQDWIAIVTIEEVGGG